MEAVFENEASAYGVREVVRPFPPVSKGPGWEKPPLLKRLGWGEVDRFEGWE